MRKLMLLFLVVGLLAFPLMAQDYPRIEVFAGGEFMRLGGGGTDVNMPGGDVSATVNFKDWLGATADFSGAYKIITVNNVNVNAKVYSYAGGPVVSANSAGRLTPFVHALFGQARVTGSAGVGGVPASGSANGFTMLMGGGVDFKVKRLIAVRLFQADWVYYRISGETESQNGRVSAGVVLRF